MWHTEAFPEPSVICGIDKLEVKMPPLASVNPLILTSIILYLAGMFNIDYFVLCEEN